MQVRVLAGALIREGNDYLLEHYIKDGYKSSHINAGTVSVIENKPTMNWNSLDEWEGI